MLARPKLCEGGRTTGILRPVRPFSSYATRLVCATIVRYGVRSPPQRRSDPHGTTRRDSVLRGTHFRREVYRSQEDRDMGSGRTSATRARATCISKIHELVRSLGGDPGEPVKKERAALLCYFFSVASLGLRVMVFRHFVQTSTRFPRR